jgi:hypothetical protein
MNEQLEKIIEAKKKELHNLLTVYQYKDIDNYVSSTIKEAYNQAIKNAIELCEDAVNQEQNKLGEEPKKVSAYKELRQQLSKLKEQ